MKDYPYLCSAIKKKKSMKERKRCYSVWVGGGEINDSYLTNAEAKLLAEEWRAKGDDDVVIEKVF